MTKAEKREKRSWFLLMVGYFAAGYLFTNWLASRHACYFNVSFPFERHIPFMPIFILGYACVYAGMFIAYLVIDDARDWKRAIVGFFLLTTICYVFFLFLPVKMEMRPDLSAATGVLAEITRIFYIIDMPYNCFPSLHVTYPTFATLVVWRNHRRMRWLLGGMALVVAVSVILVKQHYIADVIAGFFVAFFCYFVAVKSEEILPGWYRLEQSKD